VAIARIERKDMTEKIQDNKKPYEQAYFPPVPTPFTKFMRNCVVWQLLRFAVINIKMIIVVVRSH
jgi:hypothetical protein